MLPHLDFILYLEKTNVWLVWIHELFVIDKQLSDFCLSHWHESLVLKLLSINPCLPRKLGEHVVEVVK